MCLLSYCLKSTQLSNKRENALILHTRFATFPQEIEYKRNRKGPGLVWQFLGPSKMAQCGWEVRNKQMNRIQILKLALLIRLSRISQVTWQQHKCILHSWVVSTTLCVEVTGLAMVRGSLSGEECILHYNISDCNYCRMSTVCQSSLLTLIQASQSQ